MKTETTETRIRARIDEKALQRVTRMFSGSAEDICNELFQNARRANATRIRMEVSQSRRTSTVTICDDGEGIANPQMLLSYGENGWSDDLVETEDAAGMGMLSLASRGCTVHSGARGADTAWEVQLTSRHFAGEEEALVSAQAPHPRWTTRITFEDVQKAPAYFYENLHEAAQRAARHLPIPVEWSRTGFDENGKPIDETQMLEQVPFLEDATHRERWSGIRFGVLRGTEKGHARESGSLCFHGLRVERPLPTVNPIRGASWRVRAEIEHCQTLKLKLPDRRTVVETPFATRMDMQARRVIYRAMARDPKAWACYEDWVKARAEGIEIPIPPKQLRQWSATTKIEEWTNGPWNESHPWIPIDATAMIMAYPLEMYEAQALERAMKKNGMSRSLFVAEPQLKGYPWYDALPQVTDVAWKTWMEGQTMSASDAAKHADHGRPDAIWAELDVTEGETIKKMKIESDVAITVREPWNGAIPLVTASSTIEPQELAEMLHRGTFDFSEDPDADSWDTQCEESEQNAYETAVRTLRGETDAIQATLYEIVRREMAWRLPKGHEAVIQFGSMGSEKLDVKIHPTA